MRVGLNLLHARPEIGGVWTYIENVLKAMTLADTDYEFVTYCTSASAPLVPDDSRFKKREIRLSTKSQVERIAYEQTGLPLRALRDKVDCLHWFANNVSLSNAVPNLSTIHDLRMFEIPYQRPYDRFFYFRQMAKYASLHANAVIPVSISTANRIVEIFGVSRDRLFVVPTPLNGRFQRAPEEKAAEFRARFQLPSEFWLYVAHPYPHKNHERLFLAYRLLKETTGCSWPLVLRGDGSDRIEALNRIASELGIRQSVVWLPYLSSEEMVHLYSAASAAIFPYLYEGCGIPVLEAMACGCPTLASDIATTEEFAGDAVMPFDPMAAESIADAMQKFYADPSLRQSYVAKGLQRSTIFKPEMAMTRLCEAYRFAVSHKTGQI